MTTEGDNKADGIGRRSALTKAAAAGAVVWSAPTVLSSTAQAVEFLGACTAKCFLQGSWSATGPLTFLPCNVAPGEEEIQWTVPAGTPLTTFGGVCPCGSTTTTSVAEDYGDSLANPGAGAELDVSGIMFSITVNVTCADRAGNVLVSSCTGTATIDCGAGGPSCVGGCNDLAGRSFSFSVTLSCVPSLCDGDPVGGV